MLRSRLLVAVLLLSAFLFSCSGEDGATGPAGAKGADGTDGNANVIIFEYGTRTTTTGSIQYTFNATSAFVDSCLVLGYYFPSTAPNWYPIPGMGPEALYSTRPWWRASSSTVYSYWVELRSPTGSTLYTTSTTFTKAKIILVPASEIIPLTSRGLLDLSDYNAVREYLNLPE